MSWQSTYTCDVCGTVKKETNHWWLCGIEGKQIFFKPWHFVDAQSNSFKHLCGETCAATHLSRHISGLKEKAS